MNQPLICQQVIVVIEGGPNRLELPEMGIDDANAWLERNWKDLGAIFDVLDVKVVNYGNPYVISV